GALAILFNLKFKPKYSFSSLMPIQMWRGNCNVPPRRRTDCGYPGISRQTCLNRKCCFDSRYKKAKWCFYPSFSCRR
uniref:P-type domain-containing protein n=1 Tax=Laticauda laticaudata TaxID=8630 RepID=A0A8C5WNQ6_LATLA